MLDIGLNKEKDMPELGEVKRAHEVGFKGSNYCVWRACIDCGEKRWVFIRSKSQRCRHCSGKINGRTSMVNRTGKDSPVWKGGKYKNRSGYVSIYLHPNDFFYSMISKSRYVFEHRLVMARELGRCLLPWEIVHHKNGIRNDNRIENLQLLPNSHYHVSDSRLKQEVRKQTKRIETLEQRITLLEAENTILKMQGEKQNVRF